MSRARTSRRTGPVPARPGTRPVRRLDAAATARRRRVVLTAGVLTLVLGALAAAAWVVGWSGLLALREVRVDGAEGRLARQVSAVVDVAPGTPLARVDTAAVAARVRDVRAVAQVSVRRSWPYALVIEVERRQPVVAVAGAGRWRLVDVTGAAFRSVARRSATTVPLDAGLGPQAAPQRAAAAQVVAGLPPELGEMVVRVVAPSPDDVRLELSDGSIVRWGSAERSDDKARVLLSLRALDDGPPVSEFDVSAPDQPTTRSGPAPGDLS